ncbi:MAG: glycosyltransferase [Anaerolineae bacterium]
MSFTSRIRVGYVLKMYPRFSETFILNEILAHEAAGLDLEIFSLRPPNDGRFHESLAQVRAPVTYIPNSRPKVTQLWALFGQAGTDLPDLWPVLECARDEDVEDVYQAILLARMARKRGITHLHAHFGSVATTVARLAARFAGLPYSFTAHAKDIFHESVQPDDLRRKLDEALAAVTVSEYNLAYLRETYGLAARRARRVYNGLDLDQFPYKSPFDRPPRILAVGRLVEKKGFEYLIDACALLAEEGRRFEAEIIGAGALEGDLSAQIKRLGLEDRVKLLGPRPQGEVRRHVQEAAVFAAPCVVGRDGNRDGLPTVLLEAMALGTPCISTDVTGIPEVLRDGQTGLRVPQRDPAALARALARLLDDSDLRVDLAAEARHLIETEFDVHRNAAYLREIFRMTSPMAVPARRWEKEAA